MNDLWFESYYLYKIKGGHSFMLQSWWKWASLGFTKLDIIGTMWTFLLHFFTPGQEDWNWEQSPESKLLKVLQLAPCVIYVPTSFFAWWAATGNAFTTNFQELKLNHALQQILSSYGSFLNVIFLHVMLILLIFPYIMLIPFLLN